MLHAHHRIAWNTRKWGMEFLDDKWLRMNTGVAYRKILRRTNKDEIKKIQANILIKSNINYLREKT